MKLLVADDSAVYRKMLHSLLDSWQYEVVLAEDGNQALSLLQGPDAPRLAILDGVMPGLSGPELLPRHSPAGPIHLHDFAQRQ